MQNERNLLSWFVVAELRLLYPVLSSGLRVAFMSPWTNSGRLSVWAVKWRARISDSMSSLVDVLSPRTGMYTEEVRKADSESGVWHLKESMRPATPEVDMPRRVTKGERERCTIVATE